MMRRAAKRDESEPDIVQALEAVGATVQRLSADGVPDLLVMDREQAEDLLAPRPMTPAEVADLVARARLVPRPEQLPRRSRKLTDEAVVAIREARVAGRGLQDIAAEHRVSVATISRVARGLARRWVAGPLLALRIDRRTFGRPRRVVLPPLSTG